MDGGRTRTALNRPPRALGPPNFFLIGTTKGGTSTLHVWLRQHPDVYMPARKELHFFCSCPNPRLQAVDTTEAYRNLFHRRGTAVSGEASPCYMYYPDVAKLLRDFSPSARILISLRDPVERFWSHYLMHEFYNPSGRSPHQVIEECLAGERTTAINDLVGLGMYAEQVARMIDAFGPERVLITFLEHIAIAPDRVYEAIVEFLGIAPSPVDLTKKDKQYVEPRGRLGKLALRNRLVRRIGITALPPAVRRYLRARWLGDPTRKPPVPRDIERKLRRLYRQQMLQLESDLDENLPFDWHRQKS